METRVLIVDFNHMAHTYLNSGHRLSKTLEINGQIQTVDTTLQSGTIKAIHRWSRGGSYPTSVCFDSPIPCRKAYFAREFDMPVDTDEGYKGGREGLSSSAYDAIGMTKDLLLQAGVSCVKRVNYEADDLVFAAVQVAKKTYPGAPIDIITNDADLIPLVDDIVSVFMRSRKGTYAERSDLEKMKYIQITPRNYQEVVQDLSSYNKYYVPYNTLLLHKLLRGDSSDKIKGIRKMFPPRKYNELVMRMEEDWVDFGRLFRYGQCDRIDKEGNSSSRELRDILRVLRRYIGEDEEVLEHIKKAYMGMNLNQEYKNLGKVSRESGRLKPMMPFNEVDLQRSVSRLGINLKLGEY